MSKSNPPLKQALVGEALNERDVDSMTRSRRQEGSKKAKMILSNGGRCAQMEVDVLKSSMAGLQGR